MEAKISLCMIVKNEAANIGRCLSSVAGVVDEIVVVDTGSTDDTCRILGEHGIRPYSFPWTDSFSDARNASLAQATGDWILFLDADEELAVDSGMRLRKLVAESGADGYFIKVVSYLGDEKWEEPCSDLIFRLFRNRQDYRFHGAVHEQITDVILEHNGPANIQIAGEIVILHYGYLDRQVNDKDKKSRNLALLDMELRREPDNRLLLYHYGVELYRSGRFLEAADTLIRAANGLDPHTIYFPKLLRHAVLAYHAAGLDEQARGNRHARPGTVPGLRRPVLLRRNGQHAIEALRVCPRVSATGAAHPHAAHPLCRFQRHAGLSRLVPVGIPGRTVPGRGDCAALLPGFVERQRLLRPRSEERHPSPAAAAGSRRSHGFSGAGIRMLHTRGHPDGRADAAQWYAFKPALTYLELLKGPDVPEEVALWKAICLTQLRRFDEALNILRTFTGECPLFHLPSSISFSVTSSSANAARPPNISGSWSLLELPADTALIVSLLQHALANRITEPGWQIDVCDQGMVLLLDIVQRALDLGEIELARSYRPPLFSLQESPQPASR